MSADTSFSSWEEAVVWLRQQSDKKQLVMDCYYDDPIMEAADRYWRSNEWASVRKLIELSHGGNALDVGAGRGIASYALAMENFNVTALEPDDSALVGSRAIRFLARECKLSINVVEEFSESLPFDNDEFDVVFARAVLHHTKDLKAACKEFFRVLKPGGRLIAIREHVISRKKDLVSFLEQHPLHKLYGGEHAYLLEHYISMIKQSGFKKVTVISPWESSINYAPYSLETMKDEIVKRANIGILGVDRMLRILLDLPLAWMVVRQILDRIDHRPGRLYSFVAEKL